MLDQHVFVGCYCYQFRVDTKPEYDASKNALVLLNWFKRYNFYKYLAVLEKSANDKIHWQGCCWFKKKPDPNFLRKIRAFWSGKTACTYQPFSMTSCYSNVYRLAFYCLKNKGNNLFVTNLLPEKVKIFEDLKPPLERKKDKKVLLDRLVSEFVEKNPSMLFRQFCLEYCRLYKSVYSTHPKNRLQFYNVAYSHGILSFDDWLSALGVKSDIDVPSSWDEKYLDLKNQNSYLLKRLKDKLNVNLKFPKN